MGEEKTPVYESQRQRWVKYGGNVALSIVVVVVLAGIVCYGATKYARRADMTTGRSYSLKPQTIKVLGGLKDKITIVSLYPRAREGEQGERAAADASQYTAVQDLIDEYQRKSSKVETDAIDPVTEPAKLDQLITRVTQQYGSEVKKYQDYLAAYPKFAEKVKAFGDAEDKNLKALPFDKVQDPQLAQTLLLTQVTVQGFPPLLNESLESINAIKKQKIPNYKGVTEDVQNKVEQLSQLLDSLIASFKSSKDDQRVPKEIRDYFDTALPRYTEAKKLIDDEIKKIKDLGELKLDTLRQSLRQEKTILVMGNGDIKVLPLSAVWKQADTKGLDAGGPEQAPKMTFAGEQQITTAIVALTSPNKLKVCFVRPGGGPLTSSMMGQSAPFSEIADRLRDANFEVTEKDISGQWEMQAQMQGMPAPPEPTEDQIKDAIWIVLDFSPAMGRQGPNMLGPKLAEHLKQGGSAMILAFPNADPLDAALKDYGIKLETEAIAVHELVPNTGGQSTDQFEEAQRYPFIFLTTDYGTGPIARPLQSLESLLSPLVPVTVDKTAPAGVTVTPLIPIQRSIKTWGEKDELQQALDGEATKYTAGVDLPNTDADPLYGGAMVEKAAGEKGKPAQRVVTIGSIQFLMNRLLTLPDVDVFRRERRVVPRFPGNAELMMNGVYWLGRMETMMDISPAALQVSRIKPMSAGAQNFWKVGVLMVGLPALVLLLGAMVYVKRQD